MAASDHAPILLSCKQPQSTSKTYRLEKAWFKYPKLLEVVQANWQQGNDFEDFASRCKNMHTQLSQWHVQNFSKLREQLEFCKRAVLFFDQIEEHRSLDAREYQLRLKIRERIFELASFEEERWFQRSHCKWLTSGDRNTSYFHNIASSRVRVNSVIQLHHDGQLIT